jgi:hypothetical protein
MSPEPSPQDSLGDSVSPNGSSTDASGVARPISSTSELLAAPEVHEQDSNPAKDKNYHGKDLRALNLCGADMAGADLRGSDLSGMDLRGTNFNEAQLGGANLKGANLRGANLAGAQMNEARLTGACLANVKARGVEMRDANLTRCDLAGIDLQRSDLRNTKMYAVKVPKADFSRCDLRGCHMAGITSYEDAEWKNVDLRDIDLHGTYLARRYIADQNYLHEFKSRGTLAKLHYYGWWLTSDCGRSLTRWGVLTTVIMMTFAIAYSMVPMDYCAYATWLSPIYLSVVTMTTLGFGDALPTTVSGQLLVMIEVTAGYVMLGGLLSIFSSRMARRAE